MSSPPPPPLPPAAPAYTAPLPSVKRMSRSGGPSSRYAASNNEAQLVSPLSEYPIKRQRITQSSLSIQHTDQQTSIQPQTTFTMQPFTRSSISMVSDISGGGVILVYSFY